MKNDVNFFWNVSDHDILARCTGVLCASLSFEQLLSGIHSRQPKYQPINGIVKDMADMQPTTDRVIENREVQCRIQQVEVWMWVWQWSQNKWTGWSKTNALNRGETFNTTLNWYTIVSGVRNSYLLSCVPHNPASNPSTSTARWKGGDRVPQASALRKTHARTR